MVLHFSFCNVSVMPIRSEPGHRAEQTSQLLFGERAEILEVNGKDWTRIRCEWDGYEGWCKTSQLTIISRKEYRKQAKYLAATHHNKLLLGNETMWLPMGCNLYNIKSKEAGNKLKQGTYKGKKIKIADAAATCDAIKAAALQYMHAPYHWGGKTIMGIDCSGLTQMALKMCNKAIPRDASQQAEEGTLVDYLQTARCGDLAFFDNADGRIVHVGILLDNKTIIHATDSCGHVVIDHIDQGGIISAALKKRTHSLRIIKRYIPA